MTEQPFSFFSHLSSSLSVTLLFSSISYRLADSFVLSYSCSVSSEIPFGLHIPDLHDSAISGGKRITGANVVRDGRIPDTDEVQTSTLPNICKNLPYLVIHVLINRRYFPLPLIMVLILLFLIQVIFVLLQNQSMLFYHVYLIKIFAVYDLFVILYIV